MTQFRTLWLCTHVVWCGIVCNSMVWYCIVLYGTVLYCIVWYGMVRDCMEWYGMVRYCIILYCMVLYGTVLYGTKLFNGNPNNPSAPPFQNPLLCSQSAQLSDQTALCVKKVGPRPNSCHKSQPSLFEQMSKYLNQTFLHCSLLSPIF